MKSLAELTTIRDKVKQTISPREGEDGTTRILVGMATCGIAAGARPILNTFAEEVEKRTLPNIMVTQTGCVGICQFEPIVEIMVPGKEKITYVKVTPEKAVHIVEAHLIEGNPVEAYTIGAADASHI